MDWWMWVIAYFVVGFGVACELAWIVGKDGDDFRGENWALYMSWVLWPIVQAFIILELWDITLMRFFNWIADKAKEKK